MTTCSDKSATSVAKLRGSAWRLLGLLTLVLGACVPAAHMQRMEPAGPSAAEFSADDLRLYSLPQYRSLRGAAADEPRGTEAWQHRAVANALRTAYYRKHEGSAYRARDGGSPVDREPHQCLALSGGGMRSLAFTAGVLHALEKSGLYSKTEVISSVSGGGYTTYWLASAVAQGATETAVLADSTTASLTHLRQHAGELLSPTTRLSALGAILAPPDDPKGWTDHAVDFLDFAMGAIEIKEAKWNNSYGTRLEKMLVRTSKWPMMSSVVPRLTSQRLQDLVASGRLPVPVWLTTARPVGLPQCVPAQGADEIAERSRPLTYTAFEISPSGVGSEELGFLTHMLIEPRSAMAASAAAMCVPFNSQCSFLSLADASVNVNNYPVPRDPLDPPTRPPPNTDRKFDLIDGGIADNLGVFPLVRRLCSDIIVVDGEFDPYLVFEGYGYLKQQLAALDIALDVPELEVVAARNRVSPLSADGTVPCKDGVCLIRPRPECARRAPDSACTASDQLVSAVFEGQIGPILIATKAPGVPVESPWEYGERTLRVRYVKLSLDRNNLDAYPASVRERYLQQTAIRLDPSPACTAAAKNEACTFPHELTADLDYRGGQLEAYWDLGRCIIERQWAIDSSAARTERCADSDWPSLSPQ